MEVDDGFEKKFVLFLLLALVLPGFEKKFVLLELLLGQLAVEFELKKFPKFTPLLPAVLLLLVPKKFCDPLPVFESAYLFRLYLLVF